MLLGRVFHDFFATILHSISLGVLFTFMFTNYHGAHPFLLVMQGTAVFFHVKYIQMYQSLSDLSTINEMKWLEYAISATAGALAVSFMKNPGFDLISLVVVLSIFQQYGGLLIDRRIETGMQQVRTMFVMASIAQVLMFMYIGSTAMPSVALFVVYIIGWSLFGVHCGLHINYYGRPEGFLGSRYNDRAWVEAIYSCLGWTSKIMVFGTELAALEGEMTITVSVLSSVAFIAILATVARI